MKTIKIENLPYKDVFKIEDIVEQCDRCIEDTTSEIVAKIRKGGDREIMLDERIMYDAVAEREYFGLRVNDGFIDAIWRNADGTCDYMDIDEMEGYSKYEFVASFVYLLMCKARDKAEKKQDGQN